MTIKKDDAISQMTVLTVLAFGPESFSYERSQRETAAKLHPFWARVFFEITFNLNYVKLHDFPLNYMNLTI